MVPHKGVFIYSCFVFVSRKFSLSPFRVLVPPALITVLSTGLRNNQWTCGGGGGGEGEAVLSSFVCEQFINKQFSLIKYPVKPIHMNSN